MTFQPKMINADICQVERSSDRKLTQGFFAKKSCSGLWRGG